MLAATADGRQVITQFAVNARAAGGGCGTYEEFSWARRSQFGDADREA
jgi:hypothetical protein